MNIISRARDEPTMEKRAMPWRLFAVAALMLAMLTLGGRCASAYFAPHRDQIVYVGDSITFGQGSSDPASRSRPALSLEYSDVLADVINKGINGITLGSIVSTSDIRSLYRPHARNVAIVLAGSNDLEQGARGTDLHATLLAYATDLEEQGWTVAVGTILGRSFPPAIERERLVLNRIIRSGRIASTGATVIDYAALQDQGRIPLSDGIHPSDAGYVAMAALERPFVLRALHGR